MLEIGGRLLQVLKATHTQGAGRQLGNVQARPILKPQYPEMYLKPSVESNNP